jgi:hypothetical protein
VAKSKGNWFRDHYPELAMAALAAALLYSVTATYRNQVALERQSETLKSVQAEIGAMKQSLVAILIDKNADRTKAIQDLVSDTQTLKGAKHFAAGEYRQAYAIWRPAAELGNRDAKAAIAVADAALKQKALNVNLPIEERKRAAQAAGMTSDPEIFNAPDDRQ